MIRFEAAEASAWAVAEGIAALLRPAGEEPREDVMVGALVLVKALRLGGDSG
jgi:hypothetical protein